MVHCCIKFCRSSSERNEEYITFHRLPTKAAMKKRWLKAIGRLNWKPTLETRVCSRHFDSNFFRRSKNGTVCLRKGAVPKLCLPNAPTRTPVQSVHQRPPPARPRSHVVKLQTPPARTPVPYMQQQIPRFCTPGYQPVTRRKPEVHHKSLSIKLKPNGVPTLYPEPEVEQAAPSPIKTENCMITQITEELDIKSECGSDLSDAGWERVPSPAHSEASEDVEASLQTDTASENSATVKKSKYQNVSVSSYKYQEPLANVVICDVVSHANTDNQPPPSTSGLEAAATADTKKDTLNTRLTFQDVFQSNINMSKYNPQYKAHSSSDISKDITNLTQNYQYVPLLKKSHSPKYQDWSSSTRELRGTTNFGQNIQLTPRIKEVHSLKYQDLSEIQDKTHSRRKKPDKPLEHQEFSISRHRYQDIPHWRSKDQSAHLPTQGFSALFGARSKSNTVKYKKLSSTNTVKTEYRPDPKSQIQFVSQLKPVDHKLSQPRPGQAVQIDHTYTQFCHLDDDDEMPALSMHCDRGTSPMRNYRDRATSPILPINYGIVDKDFLITKQDRKIERVTTRFKEQRMKLRALRQRVRRQDKRISTLLHCLEKSTKNNDKTSSLAPSSVVETTTPNNHTPNLNNFTIANQNFLVLEPLKFLEAVRQQTANQSTVVVEPVTSSSALPHISTLNTNRPTPVVEPVSNGVLQCLPTDKPNVPTPAVSSALVPDISTPTNAEARPKHKRKMVKSTQTNSEVIENPTPANAEVVVSRTPTPTNTEFVVSRSPTPNNSETEASRPPTPTSYEERTISTPTSCMNRPNHTKIIIKSNCKPEETRKKSGIKRRTTTNNVSSRELSKRSNTRQPSHTSTRPATAKHNTVTQSPASNNTITKTTTTNNTITRTTTTNNTASNNTITQHTTTSVDTATTSTLSTTASINTITRPPTSHTSAAQSRSSIKHLVFKQGVPSSLNQVITLVTTPSKSVVIPKTNKVAKRNVAMKSFPTPTKSVASPNINKIVMNPTPNKTVVVRKVTVTPPTLSNSLAQPLAVRRADDHSLCLVYDLSALSEPITMEHDT